MRPWPKAYVLLDGVAAFGSLREAAALLEQELWATGVSRNELARRSRVPRKRVGRILAGGVPSRLELHRLAKALMGVETGGAGDEQG